MSGDQNQNNNNNQQKQKGGGGGNQQGLTFSRNHQAGNDLWTSVRTVVSEGVGMVAGVIVSGLVFEGIAKLFPSLAKAKPQGGGDGGDIHPGKAAGILGRASEQEIVKYVKGNPKLLEAAKIATAIDVTPKPVAGDVEAH